MVASLEPKRSHQPKGIPVMTTNKKDTKLEMSSTCAALLQGVNALPDSTFEMDGQTYAKAAVLGPLNAFIAAVAATTATHSAWLKAVQDEEAAAGAAHAMVAILKPYLRARLGKSNPALQSKFGVAPVKKAKKPVAVKSAAIAKSKATRAARHTMGSKQRASVKGTVAAPAAQAPATPPAPKAPTS
jgi:hypothetical protein